MSKIKLKNVRLSFPSLFQKATFEGKLTKYEATLLLSKEEHEGLIKNIEDEIGYRIKKDLKGIKLGAHLRCLKDGDEIDYAGYAGHMSLKASNGKRPMIIDNDKTTLVEDDNKIYAGCYVNAIVDLWVQNNGFGKRINANLLGIQFVKDGEPFADGETAAADDFDIFGTVANEEDDNAEF